MKKLSSLSFVALAAAVLFTAGCSKKPVRDPNAGTQLGQNNQNMGVDPNAVPTDPTLGDTLLQARDLDTGTVAENAQSVVDPVYFALDRYAVAPNERSKIENAAKWLKDNPDKSLVLEGHCDWRGTAEYNLGLGDRRAGAVKRYLEFLGVDSKRLETLSKGSTDAKQTGGESEWQKDRRVDFKELKR